MINQKLKKIFTHSLFNLFLIGILNVSAVHAQSWPQSRISFVVGFAPGGSTDIAARVVAQQLTIKLGQTVVVENKPGASGAIAGDAAAKADPDGHTLFLGTSAAHVVNPLVQKTSYDGIKDFEFLGIVANTVNVLVVHPSVPAKNLSEFLALAKAQPGKLNYGSAGQGTTGHLGMELLKLNAGVFIVHVPYRGAAPAVNDLLGGAVQAAMPNLSVVLPMIKAGRLRAIAYATKDRSKLIPDVATFAESGMPGYESTTWYSLAAPAGTPPEVLQRLRQAVHALLDSPEYQALMLAQGSEVMKLSAAETLEFVRRDFRQTDALIKSAKIKIEN